MKNPFEFGRELNREQLVDRKDEVASVIATVTDAGKLFLIGPRRFGKTSILRSASDRLTSEGAIVLRFNAESYPSLDGLIYGIVTTAAEHLKGPVNTIGEKLGGFFSRLRPEVTFNVTQQSWSAKFGLDMAAAPEKQVEYLVDALNGLEELARQQPAGRPVGLILDEFQQVIALGGLSAEAQLRSAIQQHSRVGYVFAGSNVRMLQDMTSKPSRPFYRLGSLRYIGPVPSVDFIRFLEKTFKKSGFTVEPQALDRILTLARHVPYNVQLLANIVWTSLKEDARPQPKVTTGVVNAALALYLVRNSVFYTKMWRVLNSTQQKTLLAFVESDGRHIYAAQTVMTIGKSVSTVQRAMASLVSQEILREDFTGQTDTLDFEDPFFAHWLRTLPLRA